MSMGTFRHACTEAETSLRKGEANMSVHSSLVCINVNM